jgi:hypothetical protein
VLKKFVYLWVSTICSNLHGVSFIILKSVSLDLNTVSPYFPFKFWSYFRTIYWAFLYNKLLFSCFFLGFFIMLCKLTFRALAKNVSQNQCISLSVVDQSSLFWLFSVFTPRLEVLVRPENQFQNHVSTNCLDLLLFHTIFMFLSRLFWASFVSNMF